MPSHPRQSELDLAIRAARAAGERLRSMMLQPIEVLSQLGRDIKLAADQAAEETILGLLRAESTHPIITEEAGEFGAAGQGLTWIVDPLDGTLNFSRQSPLCCTAVGLADGDRPVLGVIYDFNRDELYTGFADGGAWCNGEPIRVAEPRDPSQAILCCGLPTYTELGPAEIGQFVGLLSRFKKTRMLGSASISLAWVARGRIDSYFETDTSIWDAVPGVAIVLGAGGAADYHRTGARAWSVSTRAAAAPALLV